MASEKGRPRKNNKQSDPLISKLADQTFVASEAAPGHQVCYIVAAPTMKVMFEQLEYLLAHESQGCPAGCQDCIRLREVEGWLLQPFRATEIRGGRV
jgi:hypothetical protein